MTVKRFALYCIVLSSFISVSAHAMGGGLESLRQTGKAFATVAKSVSPSVVFIQVESEPNAPEIERFPFSFGDGWPFTGKEFKRFFGEPFQAVPKRPHRKRKAMGQGSGFILPNQGGMLSDKTYILTNNHVVDDAQTIRVKLNDGREYEAEVTGHDPQSDIAVIEIAERGLPALPLGDSSRLEVGEWVVAMGNPFGLSHTLTVGVVSATGRTSLGLNDYEDFIQTDAAINPGNSGGPLVNLDGEAIGMNTAIFSRSGGYMGVGFAIPINLAKNIADQLIQDGTVTRGYLGIMIQQLTAALAESFGIEPGEGILVAEVSDDTPAQQAGLRQGDVIVAYRGKPVSDIGSFRNAIALTAPGSREKLTVLRDGQQLTLIVTIGTLSKEKLATAGSAHASDELGLTIQTLTPQLAESFGAEAGQGVVVTEVEAGSVAARAGIDTGTVILQVNRKPVTSVDEFQRMIRDSSDSGRVVLLLRKDNRQRYVALSW
jgi:serine protease Do